MAKFVRVEPPDKIASEEHCTGQKCDREKLVNILFPVDRVLISFVQRSQ